MWAQVVPVEKIWGQCAGQWNSRWLRKWVRPRNFPDGGRAGDPSLIRSPVGQMWDSLNAAIPPHKEVICRRAVDQLIWKLRCKLARGQELCLDLTHREVFLHSW